MLIFSIMPAGSPASALAISLSINSYSFRREFCGDTIRLSKVTGRYGFSIKLNTRRTSLVMRESAVSNE
ncbi:hypothetical protein D3C87_1867600 [compost metagenome]